MITKILMYHYLTLPLKVIKNFTIFIKLSLLKSEPVESKRVELESLPVFKNDKVELYVPGVIDPDGSNHDLKEQCLHQGYYSFLLNLLNKNNDKVVSGLKSHLWGSMLLNGYKQTGEYDYQDVSIRTLHGLNLGLFSGYNKPTSIQYANEYGYIKDTNFLDELKESYDEFLDSVIKNNGAITKRTVTGFDTKEIEASADMRPRKELNDVEALVLLTSLKIGSTVLKSKKFTELYNKFFYNYLYSVLCIFPTNNDTETSRFSLYMLKHLSTNKWEKMYWSFLLRLSESVYRKMKKSNILISLIDNVMLELNKR